MFFTRGSSLNTNNKPHKTHTTPEITAALKSLPLELKLQNNVKIIAQNTSRRQRRLNRLRNPELELSPASSTASLITIATEEYDDIRKSKALFRRLETLIPIKWLYWMENKDKEEEVRASSGPGNTSALAATGAAAGASDRLGERVYAPKVIPPITGKRVRGIPAGSAEVKFHPDLFITANYHRLPLGLFTTENLLHLTDNANANGTMLPTKKIYPSNLNGQKVIILDVPRICKDLLGIPIDDFKFEGLQDFHEFMDAADNYQRFQIQRDVDGEKGHLGSFVTQHFRFFMKQTQSARLYRYWKPVESRLRREHEICHYVFDQETYCREWRACERQKRDEDEMEKVVEEKVREVLRAESKYRRV